MKSKRDATVNEPEAGRRVRLGDSALRGRITGRRGSRLVVETRLGRLQAPAHSLRDDIFPEPPRPALVTLTHDPRGSSDRIDLHECLVEDVENRLAAFLDRALVEDRRRVVVIHGKGRGLVRREVWRCLAAHPQVERHAFADPSEGSFGATVVCLR